MIPSSCPTMALPLRSLSHPQSWSLRLDSLFQHSFPGASIQPDSPSAPRKYLGSVYACFLSLSYLTCTSQRSMELPCSVPLGSPIHLPSSCDIAAVGSAIILHFRHHASDCHILNLLPRSLALTLKTQSSFSRSLPTQMSRHVLLDRSCKLWIRRFFGSILPMNYTIPAASHVKVSDNDGQLEARKPLYRAGFAQLCSYYI